MISKQIRTVLLVACATLFPLAVSADPKLIPNPYADAAKTAESNLNASLVGSLADLAKAPDDNRFGTNKPLGFYYSGHNVEFKSPYAKLPAKTIAQFALDLHNFLISQGGGFGGYEHALIHPPGLHVPFSTDPVSAKAMQMLHHQSATREALITAHVAYDKQKEYARTWWSSHDPNFKKELMPDWWINDSILDANYLFLKFQQKTGANNKEFMDSELDKLANHN